MRNLVILLVLFVFYSPTFAKLKLEQLAKKDWIEVQSEHFHLVTDAKPNVGKRLVQDMENYRHFIAITLGKDLIEGVQPLKIFAVARASTFNKLNLPDNWGGAFIHSIDGPTVIVDISGYSAREHDSSWGSHIMMHEYVHYAIRHALDAPFYPPWYDEGIADYLATFRIKKNNTISVGELQFLSDSLSRLRTRIGRFKKVDAEDLFKTRSLKISWREEKSSKKKREFKKDFYDFYARSVATMHYFHSSKQLRASLEDYISLINRGLVIDKAFKQAFSMTYAELDDAILDYIANKKLVGWNYSSNKEGGIEFPAATIKSRDISQAELYLHIAKSLYKVRSVLKQDVQKIIETAAKYNPDSPEIAKIHALRHADYFIAINWKGAQESLRNINKFIAKFPNDATLHAVRGTLLIEMAIEQQHAGLDAKSNFKNARTSFRKALKIDPFNGRAYYGLGEYYFTTNYDEPLKEGLVSLDSAQLLTSGKVAASIARKEAILNLRLNKPKEALAELRRVFAGGSSYNTGKVLRLVFEALEIHNLVNFKAESTEQGLVYEDGSIYHGPVNNGKPQGFGTLKHASGAVLKGNWLDGIVQGEGAMVTSNAIRFNGNFEGGAIMGKGQIEIPVDNSGNEIYSEGEFFYGLLDGLQKTVYPNGNIEIGHYWLGKPQGTFEIRLANGRIMNTERIGKDYKLKLADGTIYAGAVNSDLVAHGSGRCYEEGSDDIRPCRFVDGRAIEKK